MTETPVSNGRFFLKWLFPFLVHPRQTFEHVLLRKATWYTPLLVVSLLIVAQVAILASRTDSGAVMIPADGMPIEGIPAQGMGTESGSGFAGEGEISPDGMMPGAESSTGWRSTLLPIAGRLTGLWIGWFVLTLLLFVALVISGSQGNFTQSLNLTAWCSLPFAVQLIAQILLAFAYSPAAATPQGLAGLASKAPGLAGEFLGIAFQRVDVFLIWQVALLMIGTVQMSQLPAGKARWLVLLAVLIYLVLAALPALGMEQFSIIQDAAQPQYY